MTVNLTIRSVPRSRLLRILVALLAVTSIVLYTLTRSTTTSSASQIPPPRPRTNDPRVHLLIGATKRDSHLCKTLLSSSILGYPSPTLLAWDAPINPEAEHGGTHMMKIAKLAEYLQSISPEQDDDLVVLIDGYDMNFQLPVEVLIERYYRVTDKSNARLESTFGRAYHMENIREQILFAAEKARWPNPRNHISTWTLPESTGPEDAYFNNTDTVIGSTTASSSRPRYLNGGFVIGTMSSMRRLFMDTQDRLAKNEIKLYASDSDQGVMSTIMGEQNYMREVARLKHLSFFERLFNPSLAKPRSNQLVDLFVDNILSPSFTHDEFRPDPARNYEYGIGLDYEMDFTHQTSHSEVGKDTEWITYRDFNQTVEEIKKDRGEFDCKLHVKPELPADLLRSRLPPPNALDTPDTDNQEPRQLHWEEVPLYTQLCFGTIPVMVHYNGDKGSRDRNWRRMWMFQNAQNLLSIEQSQGQKPASAINDWDEFKKQPASKHAGGAWTDTGTWMSWDDLCPARYQRNIFPHP